MDRRILGILAVITLFAISNIMLAKSHLNVGKTAQRLSAHADHVICAYAELYSSERGYLRALQDQYLNAHLPASYRLHDSRFIDLDQTFIQIHSAFVESNPVPEFFDDFCLDDSLAARGQLFNSFLIQVERCANDRWGTLWYNWLPWHWLPDRSRFSYVRIRLSDNEVLRDETRSAISNKNIQVLLELQNENLPPSVSALGQSVICS